MPSLFQGSRTPKIKQTASSASMVAKAIAKQATIDFYKDKIEWLETGRHPALLLKLTCRDVPASELQGLSVNDPKPFIKSALRYYKKRIRELAGA